jgi:hypothetical protein
MNEVVANNDNALPAIIHLNFPDIAYLTWVRWRALEKRFMPSVIKQEPEGLLDDVLQLDALYERLKGLSESND